MSGTQKTKPYIGIIGGMGPEATVLLMSRIIALTDAQDDQDHVPLLVDNNTQVPSRIKALIEKTGDDPGPVLANMARRLEQAGASALAMPCNTAHAYAAEIQSAVSIPFLNMVQLSVDMIARAAAKSRQRPRVGIMASPAVRITGIFDDAFAARQIDTVYPSDQEAMLNAIRLIKQGVSDARVRKMLAAAALELEQQGVATALVACTELSLIRDAIPESLEVIDTMDVLASAVVNFALKNTLDNASG